MNTTQNMIIRHCIRCDATLQGNHFQEWLVILKAGTKTKLHDTKPHLDMEYIQEGLRCETCHRQGIDDSVIMVVFKWGSKE
tara:strand:- start:10 stop:252 length:243 start_codon:yes stop_codon:yes gene_type:complete